MAKAPQPGRTKTRLVPPLISQRGGPELAFLRDITGNVALAAGEAPVAGGVAYAPAGAEALFDGVLAAGTFLLLADGSPAVPPAVHGFGRSLLHAVGQCCTSGYGAACVLNSDSPTLPTAYLCRAAARADGAGRPGRARPGRGRRLLPPGHDGTARAPVRGYRLEHRAGRRADAGARADAGLQVVELPMVRCGRSVGLTGCRMSCAHRRPAHIRRRPRRPVLPA